MLSIGLSNNWPLHSPESGREVSDNTSGREWVRFARQGPGSGVCGARARERRGLAGGSAKIRPNQQGQWELSVELGPQGDCLDVQKLFQICGPHFAQ